MLSGPCRHKDIQPYESVVHDPLAKISPHFYRSEPIRARRCAGLEKDRTNFDISSMIVNRKRALDHCTIDVAARVRRGSLTPYVGTRVSTARKA